MPCSEAKAVTLPIVVAPIPRLGTLIILSTDRSSTPLAMVLRYAKNVFDFPPLIEVHSSHKLVRHIVENTPLLNQAGLRVGPVKHRLILAG